jgi:hypothetical protein
MANETVVTVVGNLTADPELRFTPSGAAVANFTVASTPRTFDRQSGEWKDGERCALPASRQLHLPASLHTSRGGQPEAIPAAPGRRRLVVDGFAVGWVMAVGLSRGV